MYTNIDGLLSGMLELRDYLREKKPDVICLTKTKLRKEIQLNFKKEGYHIWRRDREEKGGGGVLIMTRDGINVEDVKRGGEKTEVISIKIRMMRGDKRRIILAYIPPKTNAWGHEEYKSMRNGAMRYLDNLLSEGGKVLMLGDFNCKNINWKDMEVKGNLGTWEEKMVQLAMVNTMDQWVDEYTRHRGEDEPSMLDLVFTKRPEAGPSMEYLSPIGKSDHVTIEIELQDTEVQFRNEEHRNGRLNHAKTNFETNEGLLQWS